MLVGWRDATPHRVVSHALVHCLGCLHFALPEQRKCDGPVGTGLRYTGQVAPPEVLADQTRVDGGLERPVGGLLLSSRCALCPQRSNSKWISCEMPVRLSSSTLHTYPGSIHLTDTPTPRQERNYRVMTSVRFADLMIHHGARIVHRHA